MANRRRYLLDTGLLLGLTRRARWARYTVDHLKLDSPEVLSYTSAICHGEILALAEKRGWGRTKRMELEQVLRDLPRLDINRAPILSAYALIDAWTHGGRVDSPGNAPPPQPAISMSQNDLWIAATAHASNAALVSTDKDFHHLHSVWFEFVFVDQTCDQ